MSIVACKKCKKAIHIASDSITVRGWTQYKGSNSHSKLDVINNMIIGSCGSVEESTLFQTFMTTHNIKENILDNIKICDIIRYITEFSKWKKSITEDHRIFNDFIIISNSQAFHICGFMVEEILDYEAIGAGMDFALASMYLGKGVREAVKAACELSVYCEEPIISYTYDLDTFSIKKDDY